MCTYKLQLRLEMKKPSINTIVDLLCGLPRRMKSATCVQVTCGRLLSPKSSALHRRVILDPILALIRLLGSLYLLVLLCALFVLPAGAMGSEPVALAQPSTARRHPGGDLFGFCLFFGINALLLSRAMLSPLMGVTSILWIMMRNDSAINPKHSWM